LKRDEGWNKNDLQLKESRDSNNLDVLTFNPNKTSDYLKVNNPITVSVVQKNDKPRGKAASEAEAKQFNLTSDMFKQLMEDSQLLDSADKSDVSSKVDI